MYLGTQFYDWDDVYLKSLAQLGVAHVCVNPRGSASSWTREVIEKHRDHVASFGLTLDMIELPMTSQPIDKQPSPHILLGQSPERDSELDVICQIIENLGAAGVPAAKYNLNIIGIPRTEPELGRGGSTNMAFRWDKADHDEPGPAGIVPEEENWARIEYFLDRVVPAAEAAKVRLACHPHDPYTPEGYKGVTRVLGSVEGLKRFVMTHESPYHGLNFCQGTVAEMLENPDKEIDDVIRWFGERKKIFNVHFRNISGGKLSFMETFPDEGDMDMSRTLDVYASVDYPYMIMPDHVPTIDGKDPAGTAFSFCFGYIRGMMDYREHHLKAKVATSAASAA